MTNEEIVKFNNKEDIKNYYSEQIKAGAKVNIEDVQKACESIDLSAEDIDDVIDFVNANNGSIDEEMVMEDDDDDISDEELSKELEEVKQEELTFDDSVFSDDNHTYDSVKIYLQGIGKIRTLSGNAALPYVFFTSSGCVF